jgi:hypothetical protein
MDRIFAGGCACGAVRYETRAEPVFQNHCQCRDCQMRSGTGHGSYLTFGRRAEMTTSGETSAWRVTGDSGKVKVHRFCPTCGTPVFLTFEAMPELITVTATSLDDPDQFTPQAVTYTVGGHAWDRLDPAVPGFERMPG